MVELSIIVPVYNVEMYLRKCINSLLDQDISSKTYEIVLVDDGSTDRSAAIVDEYARTFDNIKAVHQNNRGLSGARNTGISISEGEYVQFVDSDDYLESFVLGGLLALVKHKDLDVLRFNYRNVNERYETIEPNKQPRPYADYSHFVSNGSDFLVKRLGYACYAWQFIIRKSIVTDCLFVEGLLFEDVEWTPRMLQRANRVSSCPTVCYNYLLRNGSITKSNNDGHKRKAIQDKLNIIDEFRRQAEFIDDCKWHKRMISGLVLGILSTVATDFYNERHEYIISLRGKNVFPLTLSCSTRSGLRKKLIINISPSLFCYVMHSHKL